MATGQWLLGEQGNRWFFDSGALCLDFAYTGPFGGHEGPELLTSPHGLGDWIAERHPAFDGQTTERELTDARALREVIAAMAITIADGNAPTADSIDVLNLFAATPDIPPAMDGGRRKAGAASVRVGQVLSTIARDGIGLFGRDTGGRLRRCDAADCGLLFYDESRAGSRRWCSMQRCGNRAKVKAYRARIN